MAELRNLDLNLLVVFQYLLEERNISAVARRLGLSPPAVSNALRRMRATLRAYLFVRTPHCMLPAPHAERMCGPVSEALALLSHTLEATHEFRPAHSQRRFRIAMSDVGEIHFMPRLIELCARHAPAVRIDSLRLQGADLRREMDAGRVDLAIGAFEGLAAASCSECCSARGTPRCFAGATPARTKA